MLDAAAPLPPPPLIVTVGALVYPAPPASTSTRSTTPDDTDSRVLPAAPLTVYPPWLTHEPVRDAGSFASNHHVSDDPSSVGVHTGVTVVVIAGPLPWALAAVTDSVYATLLVRPVTVQVVVGGVAVQLLVLWPGAVAVTVYDSSGAWPFSTGAVHDTAARPSPATAVAAVGAGGGPGVTVFEASDCMPVPTAFRASTKNTYAVPLVRPRMPQLVADGAAVHVAPPGQAVTR